MNYNDIKDYQYNPFTKTKYYIPVINESHIIPSSPIFGAYLIFLDHAPKEDVPTSVSITIGGLPLFEVSANSSPANMQYRVYYDEEGCGTIEFNSNQKGLTALVSYLHYGTFNSKSFAEAILNSADALYAQNIIIGCSITNNALDSDHDIDFGSGTIYNSSNKQKILVTAKTKKLDSIWSIGNGGGLLDTGSIQANKDYYLYIIGKTNDGISNDILASLDPVTPALPATWTNYTLIGICQTDIASKIIQGKWRRNGKNLNFRYKDFILDRPLSAPIDINRILVVLTAPLNSLINICFQGYAYKLNPNTIYFVYGETFETDILPTSIDTSKMALYNNTVTNTEGNSTIIDNLKSDNNKQIFFRVSDISSAVGIKTLGWEITV